MIDGDRQPIPESQSSVGRWLGQAVGVLVLGAVLVGYLIALRGGMWPPGHPWSGITLVGAALLNLILPRSRGLRSAGLWIIAASLTAAGALLWLTATLTVRAQETPLQDALLDHLIGKWVLRGSIAGTETTHDIDAEWVLGHEYVRLHEVSREKDARGHAAYEAIVFIGWDQASGMYACLWLDSTGGGGLSADAIGHAKRSGDEMAFLFRVKDGSSFHTTFRYNESTDTWQWLMDGEEGGKLEPFARVKLSRK